MPSRDKLELERHQKIVRDLEGLPMYPYAPFENACMHALYQDVKKFPDLKAFYSLWKKVHSLCLEKAFMIEWTLDNLKTKRFELDTDELTFKTFQAKRLAEIFKEHPHMLHVLKSKAKNQSYNVGSRVVIQLYEKVAKNPDKYIEAARLLAEEDGAKVAVDEDELTVDETFTAMEYLIEYRNEWICTQYYEYNTIPTKADCIAVQGRRNTRNKPPTAEFTWEMTEAMRKFCMGLARTV